MIAGQAAVCAGWASTREARMACCADETTCPMHKGGSHGSSSVRTLTQSEADTCCATSERHNSTPSSSTLTAVSAAVLGPGIVRPATVPALVLTDDWRTVSPNPTPPVPRHVLLSVFLV